MSESDLKKLSELRVVDLRGELEKRGLDKNGVKKDLVERLQKALREEGVDSENHQFDISSGSDKKSGKRLSTSSSAHGDDSNANEKTELDVTNKENLVIKDEDDEMEEKPSQPIKSEKTITEDKKTLNENLKEEKKSDVSLKAAGKSVLNSDKASTTNDNENGEMSLQPETSTKKKPDADASAASVGSTDSAPKKANAQNPRVLWITNVPKNTRANDLKQLLSTCGKVLCAKVVVNSRFPGSCCFGHISMGSIEDAENVIEKLNNTEFNGQIIKIDKFENIKADNLNPKKAKSEDNKKQTLNEVKDDKGKRETETKQKENKEETTINKSNENKEMSATVSATRESPQRRKSRTSDRSSVNDSRRHSHSKERVKDVSDRPPHRGNVLTFDKIKEERERQRMRDRERAIREESRRRHDEEQRIREMREITRRQRTEAERLEREKEKLKQEREMIEREKNELLKLERERQKIEREKLEIERMEFQRMRQRIEDDERRTANKRNIPPGTVPSYRREGNFEHDNRKRHFDSVPHYPPRFEPPMLSSEPPVKKYSLGAKDIPSKRPIASSYVKHDTMFIEKRNNRPDYNTDRSLVPNAMSRSGGINKFDRSYESNIRYGPSRDPPRHKESRYGGEREHTNSPHFRSIQKSDRHSGMVGKPDRSQHYNESNSSEGWKHASGSQSSKPFSGNQKSWNSNSKGTWRSEPPTNARWNQGPGSSGRPMGFTNTSSMSPACPPPPGINTYSDRFDYKSSNVRKY